MLWEVEVQTRNHDPERKRVCEAFNLLTQTQQGPALILRSARGYLVHGDLGRKEVERLASQLLVDSLVETSGIENLDVKDPHKARHDRLTVLLKPGVMDPAAMSVLEAAHDLEIPLQAVRTFRRYYLAAHYSPQTTHQAPLTKVLANDAIEQVIDGPITANHLALGTPYRFRLVTVPLRELGDQALIRLSRAGQLSLNLAEMQSIQSYFRELDREPTDAELETLAQTWSEHCSHKTLKGKIDFDGRHFDNLLKETIFGATQEIRRRLGPDDWCVSVFEDNAGVVRFNEEYNVCFKVETHNHPSALEPYGGANTGL